MVAPPSSPVPFLMARSIFSLGVDTALAPSMAARRRGFRSGSPPPLLAASMISWAKRAKTLPFLASSLALTYLILDHLLCPDIELGIIVSVGEKRQTNKWNCSTTRGTHCHLQIPRRKGIRVRPSVNILQVPDTLLGNTPRTFRSSGYLLAVTLNTRKITYSPALAILF